MKSDLLILAIALISPAAVAIAQSGGMKGMDMDKKSMSSAEKAPALHKAVGIVKKVDPKAGTVTLAHEPVKSLNWPAMNMAFKVQDKTMLDKLTVGKKVEVEFQPVGKDHVITSMK